MTTEQPKRNFEIPSNPIHVLKGHKGPVYVVRFNSKKQLHTKIFSTSYRASLHYFYFLCEICKTAITNANSKTLFKQII